MKIAGIITEYNPFHNGHAYQLEKVRELTGCDAICVVMSGNFCQRGIPAITDKYSRTSMALSNGVDLVLELPVAYALSSAQEFACSAVEILANAGIDFLCFGAECSELEKLQTIANFLSNLSPDAFTTSIASGSTYAKAIADIVQKKLGREYFDIMSQPNNILAIEYLKALKIFPNITPILIQRKGDNYNDEVITNKNLASATAIRNAINLNTTSVLSDALPDNCIDLIHNPIFLDDFSSSFNSTMHTLIWQDFDLSTIDGISGELANKIKNNFTGMHTLSQFVALIKSKDLAYSRICRCLLKIILGITSKPDSSYLRILGFNEQGAAIIKNAKSTSSLPIITKAADCKAILAQDIHATNIYNSIVFQKYNISLLNDYRMQIKKWPVS